jgi:hypothetical protein
MKSFILILLIVGIVLLTVGYTQNYKNCPLPKIEYRYIPRSFYEEQVSSVNLKNLYSDMFNEPDTWSKYPVGNVESIDKFNPVNFGNFIQEYNGKKSNN